MNQYPTPHSRYDHLYVIVRIDEPPSGSLEDSISLVSSYASEGEAKREAERLNAVADENASKYVVFVTRLKGGGRLLPARSGATGR